MATHASGTHNEEETEESILDNNHWNRLNADDWTHVFSFVETRDLILSVSRVCSLWHDIAFNTDTLELDGNVCLRSVASERFLNLEEVLFAEPGASPALDDTNFEKLFADFIYKFKFLLTFKLCNFYELLTDELMQRFLESPAARMLKKLVVGRNCEITRLVLCDNVLATLEDIRLEGIPDFSHIALPTKCYGAPASPAPNNNENHSSNVAQVEEQKDADDSTVSFNNNNNNNIAVKRFYCNTGRVAYPKLFLRTVQAFHNLEALTLIGISPPWWDSSRDGLDLSFLKDLPQLTKLVLKDITLSTVDLTGCHKLKSAIIASTGVSRTSKILLDCHALESFELSCRHSWMPRSLRKCESISLICPSLHSLSLEVEAGADKLHFQCPAVKRLKFTNAQFSKQIFGLIESAAELESLELFKCTFSRSLTHPDDPTPVLSNAHVQHLTVEVDDEADSNANMWQACEIDLPNLVSCTAYGCWLEEAMTRLARGARNLHTLTLYVNRWAIYDSTIPSHLGARILSKNPQFKIEW